MNSSNPFLKVKQLYFIETLKISNERKIFKKNWLILGKKLILLKLTLRLHEETDNPFDLVALPSTQQCDDQEAH